MKKIKSFLIVIFSFMVLVTLVSLLMPSRVITTHTVMVNSSYENVGHFLLDLSTWKEWHPLVQNQELSISVPSTGPYAYIEWVDGNKKNGIRVLRSAPDNIMFNNTRDGERAVINDIHINRFKGRNDLEVEWVAIHELKWYPWEKFSGMFLDKMTAPGYTLALEQLKSAAEKHQ